MKEMPLVSIIMPVYNSEEYILESLGSILNQTYKNMEIIIIDDCSCDRSVEIIKKVLDNRICLVCNSINLGVAETLNKGLKLAKGKYIARMDSDDIAEPRRIEHQVKYLEKKQEAGACGTGIKFMGDMSGERIFSNQSECVLVDLLFQCALCHPTVMIRKEILDKNGLKYENEFEKAEDYRLWCKLGLYTDIVNLRGVYLNYRIHGKQVSETHKIKQQNTSDKIRMEFLKDNGIILSTKEVTVFNKACNKSALSIEEYSSLVKCSKKIVTILSKNRRFDTLYLIYVIGALVNTSYGKIEITCKKKLKKLRFSILNACIKYSSVFLFKFTRMLRL